MKDRKNILIVALLIAIVAMSVGYAALAQQLTINGTANISASWDVKIKEITPKVLTGASVKEGSPTFNNTSASFDVDLEYPGASATFDVTVENAGTINATLDSISGLDAANSDTPTYITYSVSGVTEGDALRSGDTTTATVTVTWDPSQESVPETSVSKTATINLNYVQAE